MSVGVADALDQDVDLDDVDVNVALVDVVELDVDVEDVLDEGIMT